MASAAAGGVFNAFSFAAAGYLFKLIDSNGYQKEMKRHNRAMEQLTKERDAWNEQRLAEIDRVNKLHYDKSEGLKDLSDSNKDLDFYKQEQEIEKKYQEKKPTLEKYYKPSHQMATYMSAIKVAALVPPIYAATKVLI